MDPKLDNVFLVVADLNQTGDPKKGSPESFRLTQSRLGIFLTDVDTGEPLAGWPLFTFLDLEIRYLESNAAGSDYATLAPRVYASRIPLGLLATDHVGYVSYDLTRVRELVDIALADRADTLPLTVTNDEATLANSILTKEAVRLSLNGIWIHPYGTFAFNGLTPGLFSLRPDAVVVNARLEDQPVRSLVAKAGIPSLQEPSIVDWRLSPGSFAITPGVRVGDGDCKRFTPANMAVETYYFNQVVVQSPAAATVPQVNAAPGQPATAPPPAPPPPTQPPSAFAPAPSISGPPGSAGLEWAPATGVSEPASPATSSPLVRISPMLLDVSPAAHALQPQYAFSPLPNVMPGTVFVYKTSWFQLGHSLGKVLYTLALAPGENGDVAVIDWSREDAAMRAETTKLTEALVADLRRDRLVGETIDGILNEKQSGGSTMGAGSLVGGIAGTTGAVGAMAGLGLSLGGGSAWTEGHRDLHDATVQTVGDRIQQSSSALRELRSTVVVSAHQQEQNAITTRNITNYNHSHTLTILYYELLRHLRVVTEFERGFDAVLVRFPALQINGNQPEALLPFAPFLKNYLMDASLAPAFDALTQLDLEMRRPDPQAQPTPQQSLRIRRVIGSLGVRAQVHVDANNHGIGLALARVPPPDATIGCSEPSQFSVTPIAQVTTVPVLDAVWSTVPKFENNKDDQLRTEQMVSFVLTPNGEVDWTDLDGLKVQCVFQGPDNAQQFVVRLAQAVAITDDQPVDLNLSEPPTFPFQGTDWDGRRVDALGNQDRRVTVIGEFAFKRPPLPKPARAPFDRLTPDQQAAILRLIGHVQANIDYYSTVYWIVSEQARITALQALGTAFGGSYWPVTTLGSYLVFPKLVSRPVDPDEFVEDERLITLPTRGVFADAKLGECNVSEIIDPSRFWDWQQSPIPFRAPEITNVAPSSAYQAPSGLQPTALPAPIVSIQTAPAAPDPAVAAGLQALTTPNIFRDMSIASQVAGVVQQVTDAAKQVAIAAGSLVKPASSGKSSSTQAQSGTGGDGTSTQSQTPSSSGAQQPPASGTGTTSAQSPTSTVKDGGQPKPVPVKQATKAQQSASNSRLITFVFLFNTNSNMFGQWKVTFVQKSSELDPIYSDTMIDTTGTAPAGVGNRMEITVPPWLGADGDAVTIQITGAIRQMPETIVAGSRSYVTTGWDYARSFSKVIPNAAFMKSNTYLVVQPTKDVEFSVSVTKGASSTDAHAFDESAGLEVGVGTSLNLGGKVDGKVVDLTSSETLQVNAKGTLGFHAQQQSSQTSQEGITYVDKFIGKQVSNDDPDITPVT